MRLSDFGQWFSSSAYATGNLSWEDVYAPRFYQQWEVAESSSAENIKKHINIITKTNEDINESSTELNDFISEFVVKE